MNKVSRNIIQTVPSLNNKKHKEGGVSKYKGLYRASIASSIAAMPIYIVSNAIGENTSKYKYNAQEIKQFDIASHIALQTAKDGILWKNGTRILKCQQVDALNYKEIAKKGLETFETIFKKDAEPNEIINAIDNFLNPYKFEKQDIKAYNRLYNAYFDQFKTKLYKKNIKNKEIIEPLLGQIAKFKAKFAVSTFKTGKNAAFDTVAKQIIMPNKSHQSSVFHEIGHALNQNSVLKYLQNMRPYAPAAAEMFLFAALLAPRKKDGEDGKHYNKIEKLESKIKNNIGKLTLLAGLPIVLEEGIASLKGNKIAKNLTKEGYLSKDLLKKVYSGNLKGFSTYALVYMLANVVAAKVAIAVKDKIQDNYAKKKNLD